MIGDRLRDIRKRNGYTQQKVAEYLGIDRSTYAFYETDTTNPPIVTLKKLSVLYETSVDNIIGNDKHNCSMVVGTVADSLPSELSETEQKLLDTFRKLSEEKRDAVLAMLKTLV